MPSIDSSQHSYEVQEIIGQVPSWLVRWGLTVFCSLFIVALLLSHLVRYPDVVSARLTLTTPTPPTTLVSRASGRLVLYVYEGEEVKLGQVLVVIENSARFKDIQRLGKTLLLLRPKVNQVNPNWPASLIPDGLQVGDLQTSYYNLANSLHAYQLTKQLSNYEKQLSFLQKRVAHYQRLQLQLEQQQVTRSEDLALAEKLLTTNRRLLADRVIAEVDYTRSQQDYLRVKQQLEGIESTLINNQILVAQLEGQMGELNARLVEDRDRLLTDIRTRFRTLETELTAYQQTYWVTAPLAGKITLVRFLTSNRYVPNGTELLTIVPPRQTVYGQAFVPIAGSGKVALGQRVNVKFDNFPFNEYGMVEGRVNAMAAVPREGAYPIRVTFPAGLLTNYHRQLLFRQEMTGNAEIITEDLSLLERMFYQVRSLLVQSA